MEQVQVDEDTTIDLDPEQVEREFLPFLSLTSNAEVRTIASKFFLGLTGTDRGSRFLSSKDSYMTAVCKVCKDTEIDIATIAIKTLVNLTADKRIGRKLARLPISKETIKFLLGCVLDRDSPNAEYICRLFSNWTNDLLPADVVLKVAIENKATIGLDRLVYALTIVGYNKRGQKLDYLATFLCNLTQHPEARKFILDKSKAVIQRLLPFTTYNGSVVTRGGIIGLIRNCCFETESHPWVLSSSVDVLPYLLLPLAGPEDFEDEEMEKLPPDLQYLEPTKRRESDPDLRLLLCEALFQLCATREGREHLRAKNTYIILRELHRWEQDPRARQAAENVVQILIQDESGVENLKKVDVPDDVTTKLDEGLQLMDKELQKETEAMYTSNK